MAERIHINEVGLRDGLQNQPVPVPLDAKLALYRALSRAGVTSFEATSFVNPKAVPQMSDAAEVMAQLRGEPGEISVLVPNLRGYRRAAEAGSRRIAVVLAASDTMNRRNINMSLAEASKVCAEVTAAAASDGLAVRAYIATAFGCPFEGAVDETRVLDLATQMVRAGASEIALADTIGAANPAQAEHLFSAAVARFGPEPLAAHLHDTRGMALTLAWIALGAGIRRFDASVGGLGGCPFAPGATGNLATEDLVFALNESGFETGIEMSALIEAVEVAEKITGSPQGGRIMAWWRNRIKVGDTAI